jgi:hypothetical protein
MEPNSAIFAMKQRLFCAKPGLRRIDTGSELGWPFEVMAVERFLS